MSFKTVFVMLGDDCNFQCRYCLQHPIMTEQLPSEIHPELVPYIRTLCGEDQVKLMFYGGEPLLFWAGIVELHQALKEENISFGIISNGSLLTDEMTQYLHQYGIGISISQDGANTAEYRGQNVLGDPRLLARIHRLNAGVSAVVHAENMDIEALWAYWWDKGLGVERTNIDLIMDTGLQNRSLTDFDFLEWERICGALGDQVYQTLVSGKASLAMYLGNQMLGKIKQLLSGETDEDVSARCSTKCGVGVRTVNVDLQGNCYLCHNSSERLGTIRDSYEDLVAAFKPYDRFNGTDRCQDCPVFVLCNGGCILVHEEARDRYYCRMMRTYYGAFMSAIIRAGSDVSV